MIMTTSQRNSPQYNKDGYVYNFDKYSKNGKIKFWRCSLKDSGRQMDGSRVYCMGRVWTDVADNFMSMRHNHSCSNMGDVVGVAMAKLQSAVKRRAVETTESPKQILLKVTHGASPEVLRILPSRSSLEKLIYNSRRSLTARSRAHQQDIVIKSDPDAGDKYIPS